MEKIVTRGLKIDLHIHSCVSSQKDGAKVKNNTLQNIPILIQKLNEQKVNICAITDHDKFSYEMYSMLKKAEQEDNSIQKVLPGVEFSVCFADHGKERVIHVVAIFSDQDEGKIRAIENILNDNPLEHGQAYSEAEFLSLLREIDTNTILIAHQKNTLTSSNVRKNDANSLGHLKFLEFVYTDYFEAFEFKNKRNEIINKNFLVQENLEKRVRFVTGTDCHDWTVYPSETPNEVISEFPYTYPKCLPTFKGLVMAITDESRLKPVDSFFSATKYTLPALQLSCAGEQINIPLSKGINVIIGDNSVGKSTLLHALTGYSKEKSLLPGSVKSGYKRYLERMDIKISRQITEDHIFCFDMQGEVRAKFEENKLNTTDFLRQYFPKQIDNAAYKALLDAEIARMIDYLARKFTFEEKLKKLASFRIEASEDTAESLTFLNHIRKSKRDNSSLLSISLQAETVINQVKVLSEMKLDKDDLLFLKSVLSSLFRMKEKYDNRARQIEDENTRIETVAKVVNKISERHHRSITDAQKKRSAFEENSSELINQLVDLSQLHRNIGIYEPAIPPTKIRANSNVVYDYEFVSRLKIEEINTTYFLSLLKRVLRSGTEIDWKTITEKQLKDSLLRYDDTSVLQFLDNVLHEQIAEDLKPQNAIIYHGMDKYEEMSAGLDAKIYFDLLSYESSRDGIYIIDQPEDNISQSAIRDYLLERFKTMGENRQVIMVSHNPQFIVNLDVDNLIYLSKKGTSLAVQSGALEYACDEYSILDVVAQNIDGGLESLRKRWKRYEKATEI